MLTDAMVVQALPKSGWLRDYVRWAFNCIDAPMAYHLGAGLSYLAQTLPPDLNFPAGNPIHGNLYTLLVGPSANRKTQAISLARNMALKTGLMLEGVTPGSREFLDEQLLANPKHLLVFTEFGNFLSSAKAGYLTSLKTGLTDAYDGVPLSRGVLKKGMPGRGKGKKVESKDNGNPLQIVQPRLSVLAGCSPSYLEEHTVSADWTGGFMSRFMIFVAPSTKSTRDSKSDDAGAQKLADRLTAMFEGNSDNRVGACQGFDEDSMVCWRDWKSKFSRLLEERNEEDIVGGLTRAYLFVHKVALILAWADGTARQGTPWCVSCEHIEQASRIVDLHIVSLLSVASTIAPDEEMRRRRRVLSLLSNKPQPRSVILQRSKLLSFRFDGIIRTLEQEKSILILASATDDQPWYVLREKNETDFVFVPNQEEDPSVLADVIPLVQRQASQDEEF